jgi:photosystem II stability/assembly factor-like uncharacterized protein
MEKWIALGVVAVGLLTSTTARADLFGLINTGELFVSANNGVSWTIRSTLPVRDAVGLTARTSTTELYLASKSGSVYQSLDAGASWTAVGAITASDVVDLNIRSDGAIHVITATGSVYESLDQGATFSAVGTITASDVVSLGIISGGNLYALTATGSVYESSNDGVTWTAVGAITFSNGIRLRAKGGDLYAISGAGDTYESTDGGTSWTAVGTLSQVGTRGLVSDGTNLFAATQEGHVASSADGAAWTWQGSMNQLTLTALADDTPAVVSVDPSTPLASIQFGGPFPNPTVGSRVRFSLRLDSEETVVLELYDARGKRLAIRNPETLPAGTHNLAWNPGNLRTGIYLVRLTRASGETGATTRWTILR